MLIVRIYALIWAFVVTAAGVLYLAGGLRSTAFAAIAFSAAALAGAWLLVVLPGVLHEQVRAGRGAG